MKKKVGIFINLRKPQAFTSLQSFFEKVKNSQHQFCILQSLADKIQDIPAHIEVESDDDMFTTSDLIVAFGGDGTILRTVHLVNKSEIPILGVNIGTLGFLAAASVENVSDHIEDFLNKNFRIERRSVLKLEISDIQGCWYAFNDFVIDKAGFHRVIKIITHLNSKLLNSYIADGLIISTPTGSTAYSLANGGPIVIPTDSKVFIVNPICPHTLSNRPVVYPDSAELTLNVHSELEKFQLLGDGQNLGTYSVDKTVKICRADFDALLVNIPGNDFYTTLRTKLGWGDDFRNKSRWDK